MPLHIYQGESDPIVPPPVTVDQWHRDPARPTPGRRLPSLALAGMSLWFNFVPPPVTVDQFARDPARPIPAARLPAAAAASASTVALVVAPPPPVVTVDQWMPPPAQPTPARQTPPGGPMTALGWNPYVPPPVTVEQWMPPPVRPIPGRAWTAGAAVQHLYIEVFPEPEPEPTPIAEVQITGALPPIQPISFMDHSGMTDALDGLEEELAGVNPIDPNAGGRLVAPPIPRDIPQSLAEWLRVFVQANAGAHLNHRTNWGRLSEMLERDVIITTPIPQGQSPILRVVMKRFLFSAAPAEATTYIFELDPGVDWRRIFGISVWTRAVDADTHTTADLLNNQVPGAGSVSNAPFQGNSLGIISPESGFGINLTAQIIIAPTGNLQLWVNHGGSSVLIRNYFIVCVTGLMAEATGGTFETIP